MKEIGVVLGDMEEESGDLPSPMAMDVSDPVSHLTSASLKMSIENDSPSIPTGMMMETSSPLGSSVSNANEGQPFVARSIAPPRVLEQEMPKLIKQKVQQKKRWKNVDKKKKALAVVIHELERSRQELKDSGESSASDHVYEVIMNLSELNTTGTTIDEKFVEKLRNKEIDMFDQKDKNESTFKKDDLKKKRQDTSFLPDIKRSAYIGATALGGNTGISDDAEREVEEVRNRNEERRKKLQKEIHGMQRITGRERTPKEKRVLVCFERLGDRQELTVLEKDLFVYLEHGFSSGSCPTSTRPLMIPATENKGPYVSHEE
jgi:hypothetical protein